ncbi:MAG TPA: hypothetical protein VFM72_07565, partial [Aequorivita sp.]|nr:hypothetical protein [Aequorivita sp.]
MLKKDEIIVTAPNTLPKIFIIQPIAVNYSQPKLHIPKINGKPTVEGIWYVWFNFRNSKNDKWTKVKKTHRINKTYKTVAQRREFGKSLVRTYTQLLDEGYNPLTNISTG